MIFTGKATDVPVGTKGQVLLLPNDDFFYEILVDLPGGPDIITCREDELQKVEEYEPISR